MYRIVYIHKKEVYTMDDTGFVRQPFSASFLIVGVVGFLVSLYYTWYGFNLTYGLLLMLMFAIFGVAALRSFKSAKCGKCAEMEMKTAKKAPKKAVKSKAKKRR